MMMAENNCNQVKLKYGEGVAFYLSKLNNELALNKSNTNNMLMFRGIPTSGEIESSAAFRIRNSKLVDNKNQLAFLSYHESLIKHSKENHFNHGVDYSNMSDLNILADIQHFGGATCLIDFSLNYLIALYFASAIIKDKENENGVVFVIDRNEGPNINFYSLNKSDEKKSIRELLSIRNSSIDVLNPDENRIWVWQPSKINNRIRKQDSIFIFSIQQIKRWKENNGNVQYHEICIDKDHKELLRKELENIFGISATTIFDDLTGFASIVNNRDSSLTQEMLNRQPCMRVGKELFKAGKFDLATQVFTDAIACHDRKDRKCVRDVCNENLCKDSNELLFCRGITYYEDKKYWLAFRDLNKLNDIDPSIVYFEKAYRYATSSLYALKEYEMCLEYAKKIVEVNRNDITQIVEIIELSLMLNKRDEFFRAWLKLNGDIRRDEYINMQCVFVFLTKISKILFSINTLETSPEEYVKSVNEYPKINESAKYLRAVEWNFGDLREWSKNSELENKIKLQIEREIDQIEEMQRQLKNTVKLKDSSF